LRGYLGRPEPGTGEGILLVDCSGIHTFGMAFDLDVVFLDGKGRVMKLVRSLRPWRTTRRVTGAVYVLEVPVGTIDNSGTEVGDELTWREPAPYSVSVLSDARRDGTSSSAQSGRSTG
jgi:uncharacterized membrane protein (UPF0127 family)